MLSWQCTVLLSSRRHRCRPKIYRSPASEGRRPLDHQLGFAPVPNWGDFLPPDTLMDPLLVYWHTVQRKCFMTMNEDDTIFRIYCIYIASHRALILRKHKQWHV